jgi:hypothetical protein
MHRVLFIVGLYLCISVSMVSPVSAQTPIQSGQTPSPTPVDYTLPYPGLLPGHPLSFLKEARDVIVGFFTSQPLDKAKFTLLQSDKNIQAAYLLTTRPSRKPSVLLSTITTSENYFAQAIEQMKEAKSQGIDTRDFAKQLVVANKKHQEVIGHIVLSARKEDKQAIQQEHIRSQQFGEELDVLLQK